MPLFQTVGYFECNGKGWTESWVRNTESTNLITVRDETEPLWLKRLACLGTPCVLQSYNVSFLDVKQDAILRYMNAPGPGPWSAASPDITLLTYFLNANNTRKKPVYLRGFDDAMEVEGGRVSNADVVAAFLAKYDAWRNFITTQQNPYGWMSRTIRDLNKEVLSYTTLLNGRVEFTCTAETFLPNEVTKYVQVTIRKLGASGKSVLNGTQVVYVSAENKCQTTVPVAAFEHLGEKGTIRVYDEDFVFTRASTLQKIGRRASGKVSHVTPGRAAARPKG